MSLPVVHITTLVDALGCVYFVWMAPSGSINQSSLLNRNKKGIVHGRRTRCAAVTAPAQQRQLLLDNLPSPLSLS